MGLKLGNDGLCFHDLTLITSYAFSVILNVLIFFTQVEGIQQVLQTLPVSSEEPGKVKIYNCLSLQYPITTHTKGAKLHSCLYVYI